MSRRHKKILQNFGCSAKFHPDVVVLQSIHFSRALYDHPPSLHSLEPSSGCIPLGAHARLPSACAFCTSLYVPPPGAVPAPQRTMTIGDYRRGYEQRRVGGSVEKPS